MPRIRLPLTNLKATSMPAACIVCGRPVAVHVAKTFNWRPRWMAVGFWCSLVLCLPPAAVLGIGALSGAPKIVAGGFCLGLVCCLPLVLIVVLGFLRTRRITVECPLCERHRGYWAWRGFWLLAPLLVLVAVTLTLAVLMLTRQISDESFGYLFFGTALMLLCWVLVAVVLNRGVVKAVEITEDDITLAPVHAMFAELVRFGRRRQTAAADYGWEDYDPYPRRPLAKPPEPGKKKRTTGRRETESRE